MDMQDHRQYYESVRLNICRVLAAGGYLDHVKKCGSELERWRRYLEQISRPGYPSSGDPMIEPTIFPMMDGLSRTPWRDPSQLPATAILENSTAIFRRELAAVELSQYIRYPSVILANGQWTVLPIFAFGENAGVALFSNNPFPETARIIEGLSDACPFLPLADFIFSAHAPGTHLTGHCSWDPFRLRLHLGIRIPENCRIRVGNETREWREGKVLAFHDSHEHETWNDSNEPRVVLIVDLWHPDLTLAERRAILACVRKREVRSMMMRTRAPLELQPVFERQFAAAEKNDPLVREFWGR